jgi:hypothetical protein
MTERAEHWRQNRQVLFHADLVRVCDMIDALIQGCPWTARKNTLALLDYCKEECEEAKAEIACIVNGGADTSTRRLERELGDGA